MEAAATAAAAMGEAVKSVAEKQENQRLSSTYTKS
jgi:hypothetical protein